MEMKMNEPEKKMGGEKKVAAVSGVQQPEMAVAPVEKKSVAKPLVLAATAIAIAAGAVFGVFGGGGSTGITTTMGKGAPWMPVAGVMATDDSQLTDKDWEKRKEIFDQNVAVAMASLDVMDKDTAKDYVAKTFDTGVAPGQPVPAAKEQEKQQLIQQIESGEVVMKALGVYDNLAEDGDVVHVVSGGISVQVPLYNNVQYVMVPVKKGHSAQFTVYGVYDGGGGITLGVVTPWGNLPSPAMEPGQSFSIAIP